MPRPIRPVVEAMKRCIRDEEFHIYAPPAGFEELRAGIVADLGLSGQSALVSDGAIASLYHVCHALLGPGDEFITTDPPWNWPMAFARSVGWRGAGSRRRRRDTRGNRGKRIAPV